MINWLTIESFRQLCFELASQAAWVTEEPIPQFETRYPGRLESCIETPRQTFEGSLLYPTFTDQITLLFYLLNKNHPFLNGNKRLALTALLVTLFLNGKWLNVDQDNLYRFAMGVAASEANDREHVLEAIRAFLGEHVIDLRCASSV
jgi:death-on-curing protein